MDDLNDLYYFAQVVEHGGFAPAGRALNTPKSKLSRRIALLEERLGVRLLQRSTRHFSVTEIGQEYHRHCLAMLVEAQAAREAIERSRAEPQGLVRMSCPTTLLQYRVGDLVGRFMVEHPRVQVQLEATNRRVDVLGEGLDLALRVRFPPLDSSDLVMRVLGHSPQRLVASPEFLRGLELPLRPADLSGLPSLDWGPPRDHLWSLEGPDGATAEVRHRPRLISDDMTCLRQAALRGVGVVQLPCMVVEGDLQAGRLLDIMPQWAPRSGVVHALFPSRRGLLPSVRGLIDFLAEHLGQA
ncbi:LysR family transcriptional regulator [Pseudomonas lalucatii]|uniref:LysR family transcriptional regulator n=1 Tax=Pseudomonas lalucatii TaxID=1424203 RepID=A0ABS5PYW7_9PSED|nr:LysR family transcriptional regulator [Pseudomonas lalucatii]MBS7661686.1 LysR family transcriptional regulator [Pseudomonas lalucatii]